MADMTEDEQLIALKVWWHRYGWYILSGIAVGCAIYLGWNIWQNRQMEARSAASVEYQALLESFIANDTSKINQEVKKIDGVPVPEPYAGMEALFIAKNQLAEQQIDEAVATLQAMIKVEENPFLKELAMIRLARVYLTQNEKKEKAEQVLALLPADHKPSVDRAEWLMTRAKALTILEKFDEARAIYGEIIVLYPDYSPQREWASILLADMPSAPFTSPLVGEVDAIPMAAGEG